MSSSYGQRAADRNHADLLVMDLARVSGILEEVETVWRRLKLYGENPAGSSPADLQAAARSLADTVLALPGTDCGQLQAVTFSAVTQLTALERSAARAAAVTGGSDAGDAGMWAAIQDSLHRAGKHLWHLIPRLVKISETPWEEDMAERRDAPAAQGNPPQPQPPARSGQALPAVPGG